MFTKITLDNFRSFEHIEFDLSGMGNRPKNCAIIYGENGSGKSNLISSFVFLKETLETLGNTNEAEPLKERIAMESMDLAGYGDDGISLQKFVFQMIARKTNLQMITKQYRMIDSAEGVKVKFSFQIAGHDGYYEIGFDGQNRLVGEKLYHLLNERTGMIFEISRQKADDGSGKCKTNVELSDSMFRNPSYGKKVRELIEQYWGKHTLFSILNVQSEENNEKYMEDSVGAGTISALKFFNRFSVVCDEEMQSGSRYDHYSNILLENLSRGVISKDGEKHLSVIEEALNDFFTRAYSDFKKVYYKKDPLEGKIRYELFFKKLIYGKIREISIRQESTGTQRLLENFPAFYECACGNTVLIDEMDTGIHDLLMDSVFKEVISSLKGQLVATTHNTSLIEHTPPENVYIIRIDSEGYKDIRCIKDISKTQKNHNNRNRYYEGLFGGVPLLESIDLSEIFSHMQGLMEVKK
jgi:AAA15 family ATPase/GTPase